MCSDCACNADCNKLTYRKEFNICCSFFCCPYYCCIMIFLIIGIPLLTVGIVLAQNDHYPNDWLINPIICGIGGGFLLCALIIFTSVPFRNFNLVNSTPTFQTVKIEMEVETDRI